MVEQLETLFPQSESVNPVQCPPPLRYVSLKLVFASKYPITWCRAAHCIGPADAQNLASCEAVTARSHPIHDAANCSFATKEQNTFCSRGSGVSGHRSCSRTTLLLRLQEFLDYCLILLQRVLDVVVKVEADRILVLLNLHTQEGCHQIIARDLEITFVFSDEVLLEFLTGRCMYHVINEQTMHYPISILMLHENGLSRSSRCSLLHIHGPPSTWKSAHVIAELPGASHTYSSSAVGHAPPELVLATSRVATGARMWIFSSPISPFRQACLVSDLNTVRPCFAAIAMNSRTSAAFMTGA